MQGIAGFRKGPGMVLLPSASKLQLPELLGVPDVPRVTGVSLGALRKSLQSRIERKDFRISRVSAGSSS